MKKPIHSLRALVLPLAVVALLAASCAGQPDAADGQGTLVTQNDFESVLGWDGNAQASISPEKAHSGKYAVRVGPQNEYGYTYSQALGKMTLSKAKTMTISGWVWNPSAKNPATLVLEITHSAERGTPVFYGSLPVAAAKGTGSWQLVSKTFQLPDSVQPTNQVKYYLWRGAGTEQVYADDLALRVGN